MTSFVYLFVTHCPIPVCGVQSDKLIFAQRFDSVILKYTFLALLHLSFSLNLSTWVCILQPKRTSGDYFPLFSGSVLCNSSARWMQSQLASAFWSGLLLFPPPFFGFPVGLGEMWTCCHIVEVILPSKLCKDWQTVVCYLWPLSHAGIPPLNMKNIHSHALLVLPDEDRASSALCFGLLCVLCIMSVK